MSNTQTMNKVFLALLLCFLPAFCWSLSGTAGERAAFAAVNPNYPVTPGDTYTLTYIQDDETSSLSIIVDSYYMAQIPGLRRINAAGMKYSEFKSEVEKLYQEIYPGSVPVLTISSAGIFNVLIKGEVTSAQELDAWSFERLSTLIASVKTSYTTTRKVEIVSADGETRFVDLFKATRTGNMSQDPYLSYGDTVILYPYDRQVTLSGQVRRPGTYQLTEGETLQDVISFQGGGFTQTAEKQHVEIKRPFNASNNEGSTFYIDMEKTDATMELMDMDTVTVSTKSAFLPVVYLQGAVGTTNEGTSVSSKVDVTITEGEKLSSVARKMESQFTKVSDLENAYIIRSNGDNIPANIQEILLSGDTSYDIVLEDRDIIVVPFRQYYVFVSGQVLSPGSYPYIVNKNWEYYVNLAGGFNYDNHIGRKVRIYDVYGNKYKQDERILQPEDVIYAPRNNPMYWIGKYGGDLAVIATTITTAVILVNYMNEIADRPTNYPTPASQ